MCGRTNEVLQSLCSKQLLAGCGWVDWLLNMWFVGTTWHLQAKWQSEMIKNPRTVALTCTFFSFCNTSIWALENNKLLVVFCYFRSLLLSLERKQMFTAYVEFMDQLPNIILEGDIPRHLESTDSWTAVDFHLGGPDVRPHAKSTKPNHQCSKLTYFWKIGSK